MDAFPAQHTMVLTITQLLHGNSIVEVNKMVIESLKEEKVITEQEAIKLARHILRCAFSKLAKEWSE